MGREESVTIARNGRIQAPEVLAGRHLGACACKECPSLPNALFSSMPPAQACELERHKVMNTYLPGQVIFYQDNSPLGAYCIESGRVKIYRSSGGGQRHILRISVPGEILGYRALLAREPYRATAEALDKTRICFIEKNVFNSLLNQHPTLALRLAQKACQDLGKAQENLADLVCKSVEARVAKLLVHLQETCATPAGNNRSRLQLQLSRSDLADWVGTTPETIIRILSRFRQRGLLSIHDRELTIHDLNTLSAISRCSR